MKRPLARAAFFGPPGAARWRWPVSPWRGSRWASPPPRPKRRALPGYSLVYLTELLGLATALTSRDVIFFVFAVVGFLHAAGLRPLPLVLVGTGATSSSILYFTWALPDGLLGPLDQVLALVLLYGTTRLFLERLADAHNRGLLTPDDGC